MQRSFQDIEEGIQQRRLLAQEERRAAYELRRNSGEGGGSVLQGDLHVKQEPLPAVLAPLVPTTSPQSLHINETQLQAPPAGAHNRDSQRNLVSQPHQQCQNYFV